MLPKQLLRVSVQVPDDHTLRASDLEVDATVADRVEVRRAQHIVRRHIAGEVNSHVLGWARRDSPVEARCGHGHDVRREVGDEVAPYLCAVAVGDVCRDVHRRAKLGALHNRETRPKQKEGDVVLAVEAHDLAEY